MKSTTALLIALSLAGCASTSEADGRDLLAQRTFLGADKAEVWEAVLANLRANDIPVVVADFERGRIRARQHNYLNERWAACTDLDRRNFDPLSPANLGIRSAPLYRGVDLKVEVKETATGTRLALDPRYTDVGRDYGRREYAVQIRCRSTGILEQALFTAIGNR